MGTRPTLRGSAMKTRLFPWLPLLALLLLGCHEDAVVGSLSGHVYNPFNQPLKQVAITLRGPGAERTATTNELGFYEFKDLPAGAYALQASRAHYVDASASLSIGGGTPLVHVMVLESGEPYLEVPQAPLDTSSAEGSVRLEVESNTSWAASSEQDWVTFSSQEGSGNEGLWLRWSRNEGREPRTGTVVLSAGSLRKTLQLIQGPRLQLVSHHPLPGNWSKQQVSHVQVLFNSRVRLKEIISHWPFCITDIQRTATDDEHGVRFSFNCAELGGTYPFTLVVEDRYGITLRQELQVGFYARKRELEGIILGHEPSDGDSSLWFITRTPNRVYQVSMNDLSVLRRFSLPFEPRRLALNPFRQELYLLSHGREIWVLDNQSGAVKRQVTVEPGEGEHPRDPVVYPLDLEFTRNGLGIVLLGAQGSSAMSWSVIDSRNNDTTYKHPQYQTEISGPGLFRDFESVHVNHDRSRLLLPLPYGSSGIAIFHQDTERLTEYFPPAITRGVFLAPNRTNDRIYSGQLYNQLIINPFDGYRSAESYIDNRDEGSADFSYKEGESETVYFCDEHYLRVLDYKTTTTPALYPVVHGMRGTTATTDGKYLLLYKPDFNYRQGTTDFYSDVYQFSTELL